MIESRESLFILLFGPFDCCSGGTSRSSIMLMDYPHICLINTYVHVLGLDHINSGSSPFICLWM